MKYLLFLAVCAFLQTPQTPTFKELFNGKSLSGWKVVHGTADYRVEEGQIVGTSKYGTPNTFLATKKSYKNFILEFEVKLSPGLNSGVQIRTTTDENYKAGRPFGTQIEIEDSERGWAGGIFDEARKGWRYPLEYNPKAKHAFREGEWNEYRIVAYENRIVTWVNGVQCANLLEEVVETGFIGLQVHAIKDESLAGKEIRWKNIRLAEITEDEFKQIEITAPEVSYLKNTLTDRQIAAGWRLLWNGKTTEGWRGAKLSAFPAKGWQIENGELMVMASGGGESSNGGDIVTLRQYQNFILEVDFKITEGANSGIKYFVDTELNQGAGSSIGCEFQILDDKKHPDAKKGVEGNRTMGSLYDLITADGMFYNPNLPKKKYVNALGNWNRARIEVRGDVVSHYLNGCKIIEYNRSGQMWKALVAYSKYNKWPAFGEGESGHILLQDHGDRVSFKNIKIKELN